MDKIVCFCSENWKDLRSRKLILLKLCLLLYGFAQRLFYPLLSIHMKALGLSKNESEILFSIMYIMIIIASPLAGLLSDQMINFKYVQGALCIVSGLLTILLSNFPIDREIVIYPDEVVFGLACPINSRPSLSLYQEYSKCESYPSKNKIELKLHIRSCGISCHIIGEEYPDVIMNSKEYLIYHVELDSKLEKTYKHKAEDFSDSQVISKDKYGTIRNISLNKNYLNAIRRLSKTSFYFPTVDLFNFSCEDAKSNVRCILGNKNQIKLLNGRQIEKYIVGIEVDPVYEEDKEDQRQFFTFDYINTKNNSNLTCLDNEVLTNKYLHVEITYNETEAAKRHKTHLVLGSCAPRCIASSHRDRICLNAIETNVKKNENVYWLYVSFVIVFAICFKSSFAMFEGTLVTYLRYHEGSYGFQTMFVLLGGVLAYSSFLISNIFDNEHLFDFKWIFCLISSTNLLLGFCYLSIQIIPKHSSITFFTKLMDVIKNREIIILFLCSFSLGCFSGLMESNYDKICNESLISLKSKVIFIGDLIALPIYFISSVLIRFVGNVNIIILGFLFSSIRLLGALATSEVWHLYIYHSIDSMTQGLTFVALAEYLSRLTTHNTDGSVQSLLSILHFTCGKVFGRAFENFLVEDYNLTFTLSSGLSLIIGMMFYYLLRKFHFQYNIDNEMELLRKSPKCKNKSAELIPQ